MCESVLIQILYPLPWENDQIFILIWRDFPLIWLGGIVFIYFYFLCVNQYWK